MFCLDAFVIVEEEDSGGLTVRLNHIKVATHPEEKLRHQLHDHTGCGPEVKLRHNYLMIPER